MNGHMHTHSWLRCFDASDGHCSSNNGRFVKTKEPLVPPENWVRGFPNFLNQIWGSMEKTLLFTELSHQWRGTIWILLHMFIT